MKNYQIEIKNRKTGETQVFTELSKSILRLKQKWQLKTMFDKQKKNG